MGQWNYNQRHGHGELCYGNPGGNNPKKYTGEFKNNIPYGRGTMLYANGDVYEGEFAEDRRHGQGTYTWSFGQKYVGSWVHGEYEGYGVMYYTSGKVRKGYWEKSQPVKRFGLF